MKRHKRCFLLVAPAFNQNWVWELILHQLKWFKYNDQGPIETCPQTQMGYLKQFTLRLNWYFSLVSVYFEDTKSSTFCFENRSYRLWMLKNMRYLQLKREVRINSIIKRKIKSFYLLMRSLRLLNTRKKSIFLTVLKQIIKQNLLWDLLYLWLFCLKVKL